jgi:hypothetical protein
MNNTNNKSVNRTNNKKAAEVPYNYRPIRYGNKTFPTSSKLVVYMLTHNKVAKRSQSEIARLCGVSQPCVCQLARDLLK